MKKREEEKAYLESYNESDYVKPSVAVDILVLTIDNNLLKAVAVRRDEMPFKDMWALPGVFVGINETLDEAALRGIKEETGMDEIYMEQLYTWSDINRDPRMRVISVSYIALINSKQIQLKAGKRVSDASLIPVYDLLSNTEEMAFDHAKILQYGVERIRNKVEYTQIAFELLEEKFTLPELQRVYEIILGKSLYKANFRKKVKDLIEETGDIQAGVANRPSKYYRLKEKMEVSL